MIPIEKQVSSLELSKKLNALGVTEKSYWCWKKMKSNKARDDYFLSSWDMEKRDLHAYTVAELGLLLPQYVESYRIATDQFASKFYELKEDKKGNPIHGEPIIETSNTEADARAKLLIWLIENKMLEAKKEDV